MKMAVQSAASSSPTGGSPNNLEFFYSAPSSPAKGEVGDDFSTRFDDFEFETSKKFSSSMEFELVNDENFECFLEVERKQVDKPNKIRERGGSLPTMAFADELFVNGLVMPLKPPPRLQVQTSGNLQQRSVPSSPTSAFKNPFIRRVAWNDDFDPFIVALQKVSEENRGRSSTAGSHHRRTRSHSPFRTNHSSEHHHRFNGSSKWNQLEEACLETIEINPGRSHFSNMPQEQLKGSPYARWVLDQTNQVQKLSPKRKNMLKSFTFVKSRVRPVKTDNHDKAAAAAANFGQKKGHRDNGGTKMKRIKGILRKYASFRRENCEDKSTNQNSTRRESSSYSYLKKLSFKMKGNANDENKKKRAAIMAEPKMAVVEYKRNKPNLALCFYGIESPRKQMIQ